MKIFLKVLAGLTAVYISIYVFCAALLMLMVIGVTAYGPDKWPAYTFGFVIFLGAFSIVFGVCFLAKNIIVKLNN
jgi:hypothetical protein